MKRKKNNPERFHRDKYADGPKNPQKLKAPRSTWDDENLDEALDQWQDMRNRDDDEE